MTSPILGLDHVGVVNRSLDTLTEAYTRLGFVLSPVSRHSGSLAPGAPVVPMGSGNRCAMLKQGYLELLAIVDPELEKERIEVFLARYAGLHIMAFTCEDSPAAQAHLVAAGFDVKAPHLLERMLETSRGEQLVKFRNLRLPPEDMPEGHVIVIKHETPELIWEPHLMEHPNGVVALMQTAVCVADPDEAAGRYARLFGVEAQGGDGRQEFRLPRGRFVLLTPEALGKEFPGAEAPTLPFAAAINLAVSDLRATADLLSKNGVPFRQQEKGLLVSADVAGGATLVFEPA
jgi:hypothetical protein